MPPHPPWTTDDPDGPANRRTEGHRTLPEAWRERVAEAPDSPAVVYFDGVMTAREVDDDSDAVAVGLAELGVARGSRVGVHLQNVPQYVLTMLALWKLGATVLPLNPMYRGEELRRLVEDAEPVGIVCADTRVGESRRALRGSSVRWLLSTCDRDLQTRDDPRVFTSAERPSPSSDGDLMQLIGHHRGRRPPRLGLTGQDLALLTYTSGTTGPPKGAMNTHANVLAVTSTFGAHVGLGRDDAVLAVAPLFHITGAVINAALGLLHGCRLVFTNRFHSEVVLDAFTEHGVTFTIGSITVFNALSESPRATRESFRSVRALYSGGAPVPPATVERFRERFGAYIHNAYGMTESTSGVIAVPPGEAAPVDGASGCLSIGKALPHVRARVVDPSGSSVPPGSQGELELSGPQVVPGYWRSAGATAATFPSGRLRTGDVAVIDHDGWVYLVDRLKDQINVSGYKVWPREVEDVLHQHPSVHEAAVVGRPDDYRGEAVVAHVSLASGTRATEAELLAFTRERIAAYKRPREVHVVEELPKTVTGKIRRSALRDHDPDTPVGGSRGEGGNDT
ncbi:class I adenylate-forming enzyme family protein [Nocardiopsis salina]|uniref:class I adenylate-forming enzyme family protein n=1 Tax=Nocardiopsis salina TaxID=245836 RepID=UPI00034C6C02|nr:AMP-binding protein [Nocardiopsis salina]